MNGYGIKGSQSAEPTVIIVDNECGSRGALKTLITAANYHCLSFASGESFLAAPPPPAPCCLLLDLHLDGLSGLAVQTELNARGEPPPILFVSGDDNPARTVRAMKAGALDFLYKPVAPESLLQRIDDALLASVNGDDRSRAAHHHAALLATLTPQEQRVLSLLMDGNMNGDVARNLDIGIDTVENRRQSILEKLEARTLTELVRVWLSGNS